MGRHLANILVILLVLLGTVCLGILGGIGQEGKTASALFLCFFATIVALQVIPALMVLGFLLREIFRRARRGKEKGARVDQG